ncbi:MAG TPA: N-acetylmuramoyl-L-alanine amidase [Dongiaceae bacterium]|nr:N-acetylmuramoyl-L-alanine amidase [Dongiaceae bacterium]
MHAIGRIPRLVTCLVISLIAMMALAAAALAKPAVTDARLGVEPDLTRVVLSLTDKSKFRIFTLADPYRVVIDLDEVEWMIPNGTKLQGRGLVAAMRYGLFKAGTSRVVLDLMEPAQIAGASLLPAEQGEPMRLLVDLQPIPDGQFRSQLKTAIFVSAEPAMATLAAAPGPGVDNSAPIVLAPLLKPDPDAQLAEAQDAAKPAEVTIPASKILQAPNGSKVSTPNGAKPFVPESMSTASGAAGGAAPGAVSSAAKQPENEPKRGKPLIVIDPGHGGIDPGAVGESVTEKELTLAVAKALKKELEATGKFRVSLTRSKDVYIPLRERFGLAREKGADLFISLHADSHNDPLTRGASVYTLSEKASDAEAAALAGRENKSDIIAGVDLSQQNSVVTDILIDLAQRDTKNMSTRFASLLVKELKRETMLLGNTHRYAGFAVLKAPDVPSVLVEMGYISSSKDEALLSSTKHQKRLARAIRDAIVDYFSWQEMVRKS